ncbi:RPB1 polymerase, partial [Acromyrmex heyeri]
MRVSVILVFVVFALGFVGAARRRDRLRTTTTASLVDRQFVFAGQTEELENSWNNFDSHKLNIRAGTWKNDTENRIILSARQYPGLPHNPGDTNELPNPISPPVQPAPPPYQPPPGCLGPRGQYPSSKSCANYLNCWDDVVIEQTCPAGLLFNDVAGYCDFAFNVNCGDRQPATPKPSLSAGSNLCPDSNGRYRSSTNCSEFYVCVASKPVRFNCAPNLVYNDILNVCDYQKNVDCKGTATPKPTQPPTQSPQPSSTYAPTKPPTASSKPPPQPTYPPQPPTYQPQPPTYQPQPPTYQPQPPTYQPQPPTYQPQPPTYQPQPPTYQPQPPSYQPQPPTYQPQPPTYQPQPPTYSPQPSTYPTKPPSYQPYPPPPPYSGNPWLNQAKSDSWHPRNIAKSNETLLENDEEIHKQEISTDNPTLSNQPVHDVIETSSLTNPWTLLQANLPSELKITPCHDGDMYKLNDFCTKVIVCRRNQPEVIECLPGHSYDKPSDSCMPFNFAICEPSSTPPTLH